MKRPIVCGGRNYLGIGTVKKTLDDLHAEHGFDIVINGGCPTGADDYARQWAALAQVDCLTMPAKWKKQGLSAGPTRNQRMIDIGKPDGCIAFPGGKGTADMVGKAKKAGIPVIETGVAPLNNCTSAREQDQNESPK